MKGLYKNQDDARKEALRLNGTVTKILVKNRRGKLSVKWIVTYPWPPKN